MDHPRLPMEREYPTPPSFRHYRHNTMLQYDEESVYRALDVHARAGRLEGWVRRDDGKIQCHIPGVGLWVGSYHQAFLLSLGLTAGANSETRRWQRKIQAMKEALDA